MWRLFRRSPNDPDSIVRERWETTFRFRRLARFRPERTSTFSAEIRDQTLRLTLHKRNLFAWVNDVRYRYRDFTAEAAISFAPENQYSSAGLIFRRMNDSTYYYFLASTRGYFRFDVVFNGNPIELVSWTKFAEPQEWPLKLRVVANGDRFTLCIDDAWVAEVDDETIEAGGISFAAQNYDEADSAAVFLHHILVDSRPVEVEAQHVRWREVVPVDPAARLRLAETLFSQRSYPAAIIQIRKALQHKHATAEDLFLLAECQVNLGLYEPAFENIEKSLALEPNRSQAVQERANLLYLLGRYVELRDYLADRIEGSDSSTIWNLYGHATFSLGRYEEAAAAYERAANLEEEMPLFHINAGRAFERTGKNAAALEHYLTAGRLLARQQAYEELGGLVPVIESLGPANGQGRALKGLLAFVNSEFDRAREIFESLVSGGFEDSSVAYMLGIILSREGNRERALSLFEAAVSLEPETALYWFRLAETRSLLGRSAAEALERALELSPNDQWTHNLAGQIALDEERFDDALRSLTRAHELAPGEEEITINYAEALFRTGRAAEALAILADAHSVTLLNARGNILSRLDRPEDALAAYEAAYALDRENPVVIENLAAACIELDLVNRAEELLGHLVEIAPSASVLNRIGNLARIEGDRVRAEAAYREAFSHLDLGDPTEHLSPEDHQRLSSDEHLREDVSEIEANLADLYLQWNRFDRATCCVERLRVYAPGPRVRKLAERIRLATEVHFSCATCGREWWAPKEVDVPRHLRLHGEPPADSPAGMCESCGRVYCVGCGQAHLRDGRFICPVCDQKLTLNDARLRFLAMKSIDFSERPKP